MNPQERINKRYAEAMTELDNFYAKPEKRPKYFRKLKIKKQTKIYNRRQRDG